MKTFLAICAGQALGSADYTARFCYHPAHETRRETRSGPAFRRPDSATVLALAREQGFACHCLSLDYGQRHGAELQAAAAGGCARSAPPPTAC
jgi:hypothetical protein